MAEPVRVLVVDDSSFFRKRIRHCLEVSEDITIVGEAADGEEGVRLTRELSPDLVTMDVAMPVLDGISAVRRIMAEHPTDILMFSALTREGAQSTLDALDAGAVDFISKSAGEMAQGRSNKSVFLQRVLDIVRSRGTRRAARPKRGAGASPAASKANTELVVIGASTGGPVAVQEVLTRLPADFPVPIVVAVHMPKAFTGAFAERVDGQAQIWVREAEDGDLLQPGCALVAPGGRQTRVQRVGRSLRIAVDDGGDLLYKPSVDQMFASAAESVGAGVLAIVLTGMGSDGAAGAQRLKQGGARVWAQDEASSVVYGMPAAVARNGSADRILPLAQIADALRERR